VHFAFTILHSEPRVASCGSLPTGNDGRRRVESWPTVVRETEFKLQNAKCKMQK
jgi:hypothetical protein